MITSTSPCLHKTHKKPHIRRWSWRRMKVRDFSYSGWMFVIFLTLLLHPPPTYEQPYQPHIIIDIYSSEFFFIVKRNKKIIIKNMKTLLFSHEYFSQYKASNEGSTVPHPLLTNSFSGKPSTVRGEEVSMVDLWKLKSFQKDVNHYLLRIKWETLKQCLRAILRMGIQLTDNEISSVHVSCWGTVGRFWLVVLDILKTLRT